MVADQRALVVHLIYRLDFGGLETLLVECVNHLPADKFRHAVVCLTDYSDFSQKITGPDVAIYALHKPPGLGLATHGRLWQLLRKLKPAILHTYNLSAVEYTLTAALAGVPVRIHAEHGRDIGDPLGLNRKHNLLRRWLTPLIDCFVPVSIDLQQWLRRQIGVPDQKNLLINNGVNIEIFAAEGRVASPWPAECFVIGTVGRAQSIKNHAGLIRSFIALREALPEHKDRLRLSIIGDGPLLLSLQQQVLKHGIADLVWLPGARSDVADIMRGFSVFTLPSMAEGTPVTLLEAMACSLPVVASDVGGIPEVISHEVNGILVPAGDDAGFARAFAMYYHAPEMRTEHGFAGRQLIQKKYSVTAMLAAYTQLYDTLCNKKWKK